MDNTSQIIFDNKAAICQLILRFMKEQNTLIKVFGYLRQN